MLIPIVPAVDESANVEYVRRARAATGCLMVTAPADIPEFRGLKLIVDGVEDVDRAGQLLNAGATHAVASADNLDSFVAAYPADRIIVRVGSVAEASQFCSKCAHVQVAMSLASVCSEASETAMKGLLQAHPSLVLSIVLQEQPSNDAESVEKLEMSVGRLHKLVKDRPIDVAIPIDPRALVEQPPSTLVSPGRCLLNCLVPSDRPDGLFATVVSDERGIALGLVYSSRESVLVSVGSGRGVYWSRSRSKLWRKGEESGAIQDLLLIAPDCDQDCLKFNVIQRGTPPSFCHKNTRTCWGADGGVSHLFRTLQERKVSAPAGSYTARLYGDMGLLRDKLLEEAAELSEAVKGAAEGTDLVRHVEEETADVIYFALTACVAGGGSLAEVERQLDKRSLAVKRRKGDSKPARINENDGRLKELAEAKRLKEASQGS